MATAVPPPRGKQKARIFEPGQKIAGRYEVIRRLREGASGGIYLVRHVDFPDRLIAMKVVCVTDEKDVELTAARFQNEVLATYNINHPNVVRSFDYIREGELIAYTMEYIPGGDLADLLAGNKRLTMSQVLHLVPQILGGVQAIHDAKIIHRDLKPENILLTPDGQVKISDFGTARVGTTLSKGGGISGTLAYLSPEYLRDGILDARSDIYAIGIMLYEMITGRAPFVGSTPIETITLRVNKIPPPPHQLNPDCPPGFSAVVLKALKPNPEERHQSAKEMLEAVKAVMDLSSGVHPVVLPEEQNKETLRFGSGDQLHAALAEGKRRHLERMEESAERAPLPEQPTQEETLPSASKPLVAASPRRPSGTGSHSTFSLPRASSIPQTISMGSEAAVETFKSGTKRRAGRRPLLSTKLLAFSLGMISLLIVAGLYRATESSSANPAGERSEPASSGSSDAEAVSAAEDPRDSAAGNDAAAKSLARVEAEKRLLEVQQLLAGGQASTNGAAIGRAAADPSAAEGSAVVRIGWYVRYLIVDTAEEAGALVTQLSQADLPALSRRLPPPVGRIEVLIGPFQERGDALGQQERIMNSTLARTDLSIVRVR